jgi:hypothetical protein
LGQDGWTWLDADEPGGKDFNMTTLQASRLAGCQCCCLLEDAIVAMGVQDDVSKSYCRVRLKPEGCVLLNYDYLNYSHGIVLRKDRISNTLEIYPDSGM